MILENQKLGEKEGVTILQFGTGDINISTVKNEKDEYSGIILWDRSPSEIGTETETEGLTSDDVPTKVLMSFYNDASIDVVIEKLLIAKRYLKEIKNKSH